MENTMSLKKGSRRKTISGKSKSAAKKKRPDIKLVSSRGKTRSSAHTS
jgi:hypothetical protein